MGSSKLKGRRLSLLEAAVGAILVLACLPNLASAQAPTGVYFQVHLLNYITVSWTAPLNPTGVTAYVVQYSIAGVEDRTEVIGDPTVTTITLQDDNLAGALGNVLVASVMGENVDPANIVLAVAPPASALPLAPTGATIQQTSDTSYTISWGNPGNVDGYVISYVQGASVSIELPVDRTSEQILNLTPNTDYAFNLYSQRNGIRTQAQLTVLPPVVTPPEDTVITIDELGEDFINFIWDHDSTQGIISYVVTLFASDGTTTVVNAQPKVPTTSMTHRFSGLTPGTQYVIDVDILTSSNPTASDFAREAQFTRPKPPINVILYQLSDSAILFRWQPPLSPDNFFIDYLVLTENVDSGNVLETVLPQGASSNAIRGLQSGANYNLGVFTNIEPITSVLADFTVVPLVGTAGNVTIGAVTARELVVLWMSQGIDAQSFVVRLFSEDGTEEYSQTVSAATSSAIFENLTPDTLYTAVVEAITTAGGSATVGSDFATTNTLPDSTSVIVDSTTSSSATLTWTAVPSATNYIISYISQDRSDTGTFVSTGSGTTATVPGLQPQTTYTFSVVGTDGTDVVNVGTADGTTALQTGVLVDSVTENTIDLSWTNVAGSFLYQIFYRPTGSTEAEQMASTTDGTPTTTLTGLTPSTMYDLRVVSFSPNGQLPLGNTTATTDLSSVVTLDSITSDTATLSYTAVPGAFLYTITYSDGLTNSTAQSLTNSVDIPNLSPGTTYQFSVTSSSISGQRDVGSVSGTTDIEVIVDSVSTTTATLSWTPIAGRFFYRVFYTRPDGIEQQTNPVTATTDTITGLTPGTMYTFRVEVTDGEGQRAVGTVPATTDALQTEVVVDSVTQNTAVISWTPVPGTVIYQIFYTGPDGVEQQVTSTNPTTTLTGLTPASQYNIRVQSISNTGQQLDVGPATATTDIDDCSPTNPCLNGGTCIDLVNEVFCVCLTGFSGTNCEIDIDECDPDPCVNGACVSTVGSATYTCICDQGFTGQNCETILGTETHLPETTDPLTHSTAFTMRPVTTPEPKAAINYTIYIATAAVVLLLLLVICSLLCYMKRQKSLSVRKRTSSKKEPTDASTDANPSVELRPLPLRPASRQYAVRIEMNDARDGRSDEGRLENPYTGQPHTYTDIL